MKRLYNNENVVGGTGTHDEAEAARKAYALGLKRPNPENIPQELKECNQWVKWCLAKPKDPTRPKYDKVPMHCKLRRMADITNSANFGTFADAMENIPQQFPARLECGNRSGFCGGIGFVLTAKDPYLAIDLDKCINEDDTLTEAAQEFVTLLNSYTEISPSNKGLRIFIKGKMPEDSGNKRGTFEAYDNNRFVTMTGNVYGDKRPIESRPKEIEYLCGKYLTQNGKEKARQESVDKGAMPNHTAEMLSAEEIKHRLSIARNASNGAKFIKLFDEGDSSDYPSNSEAVAALLGILVFYLGNNADLIDTVFRQSALFDETPKWSSVRRRTTWGKNAIANAISLVDKFYSPSQAQTREGDDPIDELNKSFFLLRRGNSSSIVNFFEDGGYDLLSRAKFCLRVENKFITIEENGRTRSKPLAQAWLTSSKRHERNKLVFDPSNSHAPEDFNIWGGFVYKNSTMPLEMAKELSKPYFAHVRDVICSGNETHYNYLLSWMAHLVQKPAEKPGVAVVLQGGEGTGKGCLLKPLLQMVGKIHGVSTANSNDIFGTHNTLVAHRVLIVLDEAFWAGDKQNLGKLKVLITEPTQTINPKGQGQYTIDCKARLILASNEERVVPAGRDARRFFVLHVSNVHKQDKAYFTTLYDSFEGNGVEAIFRVLQHHDITDFIVRDCPKTDALREQKMLTADSVENFWSDILENGTLPCHDNYQMEESTYQIDGNDKEDEWGKWLNTSSLHTSYLQWCKDMMLNSYAISNRGAFAKKILKLIGNPQRTTYKTGGKSHNGYRLPPHEECKRLFEAFYQ